MITKVKRGPINTLLLLNYLQKEIVWVLLTKLNPIIDSVNRNDFFVIFHVYQKNDHWNKFNKIIEKIEEKIWSNIVYEFIMFIRQWCFEYWVDCDVMMCYYYWD